MATWVNTTEGAKGPVGESNGNPVSATRVFYVQFSDLSANDQEAIQAPGVPSAGDVYAAGYTTLTARRFSSSRVNNGPLHKVTVTYETSDAGAIGNRALSPLDRPVQLSLSPRGSTQTIDTDADGDAILNSAKQTLKTQIPFSDPTLTIQRNEASYVDWFSYWNRTNNAAWRGRAAETVLFTGCSVSFQEEAYEGTVIQYYSVTYNFLMRLQRYSGDPATWKQRLIDEGTVELIGDPSKKQRPILDPRSQRPITSPVNLNGSGLRANPTGSSPAHWFNVTPFLTANFADFDVGFSGDRLLTATP